MGLFDAVGSVAGGIAGQQASSGDIGQSRDAAIIQNQILQEIQAAPDISKPLILEKYKQQGVLTPQMEQNITAAVPKTITTDPRFKTAQMQALQQMQERAIGGMTAADRAALHQAQLAAQGDVTSRLASIQQQAAQRGQAGGGSELAAKLMAAQGGANEESAAADRLAQQQQAGREQALGQMSQAAMQGQGQDFGQQFQQQQSQNEMNRFNVGNQIAQQQRNVGATNQAQANNLALQQGVANANVGQSNQEMQNQLQRQMQQYNADKNTATIKAGGYGNLAGNLNTLGQQAGQAAYNQYAGLGQAVQGLVGGGAGGSSGKSSSGGSSGDPSAGMFDQVTALAAGMAQGGRIPDFRQGGEVPGQAQVPGDHPKNDTVHAMLSPQEIVVPRSLADSKLGKELLKLIHAHNSVKNRLNQED